MNDKTIKHKEDLTEGLVLVLTEDVVFKKSCGGQIVFGKGLPVKFSSYSENEGFINVYFNYDHFSSPIESVRHF